MNAKNNQVQEDQPAVEVPIKRHSKIRIEGFRGVFMDQRFNDDGVSVLPVPLDILRRIQHEFPNAKIENVED